MILRSVLNADTVDRSTMGELLPMALVVVMRH